MKRKVIRQQQLNEFSEVGEYYLDDHSQLEPLLVQSIIDKYISLKAKHLASGDIVREDGTGEVRLILRRNKKFYVESDEDGNSTNYDLFICSTGWRVDIDVVNKIIDRIQNDEDYYNLLRG